MSGVGIPVRLLSSLAVVPGYEHEGDAGADLCAVDEVELAPFQRALIGTGIAMAIPEGFVGLIHPRSGLSARHGVTAVNAPGTIDAGYRGEIKVALINLDSHESFRVRAGDRIAQLLIQRVEHAAFGVSASLGDTARGSGGFGSTGGFAS